MKNFFILGAVILTLILPENSSFSQNVSPADMQKIIKAHPEAKKYISPEGKPTSEGERLLKTRQKDGTITPAEINEGLEKLKEKEKGQETVLPEDIPLFEEKEAKTLKLKTSKAFDDLRVFGQQLFSAGSTSFTPPSNMPVTADYIVGPDDNIVVQLWGRLNEQYTLTVQRDGSIQLPQIGSIQVAGLAYKQLQNLIKRETESITGVNASITMGKLRSITIFVVGSVKKPGAYTVSAFDTILNALIYARGPDTFGSMRNIQLKRQGKTITTFDLYDLILKGDNSKDKRLEPGDIIFVPKPETVVAIYGDIKKPALYELKKNKTLLNVMKLAGGLKPSAYSEQIQIQRYLENRERVVLDMSLDELKKEKKLFTLRDGDVVKIFPVVKEDTNAVYLFGNVTRSGKYGYSSGMRVSDIVKADDLKPETYFSYALIKRYNPPEMLVEILPFNLGEALLKYNMEENICLQHRDEVYIFNKWTFKDKPYVSISGEVRRPGKYPHEESMCVKDIILAAGDLTTDAYLKKFELYRTDLKTKKVTLKCFNLKEALDNDPNNNIELKDLDRIVIHSIWETLYKKEVSIAGEIAKPGTYEYAENMTIKDLVFAAGNLKESAYMYSAELTRYDTSGGKLFKTEVEKINLKEALEGNAKNNIKLRQFDSLFILAIPKWQKKTTISISGEAKFPGDYNFMEKGTLSELIERSGDYLQTAYLRGAVLTRESAKTSQKVMLDKLIFEMEQELAASSAATASGALSSEDVAASSAATAARQKLLEKLKATDVTGRVVINLMPLAKLKNSRYDIILENGDKLYIPKEPGTINVMGSVYNPTSLVYQNGETVKNYLAQVGGPTVNADKDQMFIIRANGTVISKTQGASHGIRWDSEDHKWFSGGFNFTILYPGDTVLVPRKLVIVSGMKWTKDITEIIYKIAIAVGAMNYVF